MYMKGYIVGAARWVGLLGLGERAGGADEKPGICSAGCAGFVASAHAADLPTAEDPPRLTTSKPPCFSSLWNYLKSSVRDCPLSVGPLTLYGTLDGGFGYEQWGARLGRIRGQAQLRHPEKQRRHPLAMVAERAQHVDHRRPPVAKDRRQLGDRRRRRSRVQSLYASLDQRRPVAGRQQSLTPRPLQRTAFDSARAGTWDNGQGFVGISNPAYGTLTFGRTTLLSVSALSAYDPVASVAFSQLGFTALYATFGASPTSRINTAFTYRLTYQGFRVAAQAQAGGYDQDNAATEQYQAQIGADFNGFSFDAIAGYAKNALTFQSFAGAATPVGYNPDFDRPRDGQEHRRRRAARPLPMGKVQILRRIYLLALRQSEQSELSGRSVVDRGGDRRSPRLRDDRRLYGSAQSQYGLDRSALCGVVQS